jgi:hypothetical protein
VASVAKFPGLADDPKSREVRQTFSFAEPCFLEGNDVRAGVGIELLELREESD